MFRVNPFVLLRVLWLVLLAYVHAGVWQRCRGNRSNRRRILRPVGLDAGRAIGVEGIVYGTMIHRVSLLIRWLR